MTDPVVITGMAQGGNGFLVQLSNDTIVQSFGSPPPLGNITPNSGAFTTLDGSVLPVGALVATALSKRFAYTINVDDNKYAVDADDTNAIKRCVSRAGVLESALIQFNSRTYLVSSTISVATSNIRFQGNGKGLTIIARNTNFADTFTVNNGAQLINISFRDMSLYHDISLGAVMTGAHLNIVGVAGYFAENLEFTFGAYGHIIAGGVYTCIRNCHYTGAYDSGVTPAKNSICADIYIATANVGAIPLPTIVYSQGNVRNGLLVDSNWQFGTVINASEQMYFDDTWNTGPNYNVYIQQLNNNPILAVTFGPACFLDSCQEANVFIDGSSGTNNGSAPIDRIIFAGACVNGEGSVPLLGPGVGLKVDGTPRGGTYDQALQSLLIFGGVWQGFYSHCMDIAGGCNINISGAHLKNNNTSNAANTHGINVGAAVKNFTATNNRIGGIDSTNTSVVNPSIVGKTRYGIAIANGATGINIQGNNVTLNTTGGILDNSTSTPKLIVNNLGYNGGRAAVAPAFPASTVAYTNAYGAPAMVQIFSGTVTSITLNGQICATSTATVVTIFVAANDVLTVTYTIVPSWLWWIQ